MQAPYSIDPTERHLEYPFGNPDGSRAPIVDVLDGFVSFGGGAAWGGLGMRPDDLTARVIVGRKGSGKTVYLRRLRAYARTHDSLYTEGYKPDKRTTAADYDFYADDVQQGLPATSQIVRFCQYWNFDNVTEKWMGLWKCAILRSVVSHLVCNPHLASYLSDKQKSALTSSFSHILRDFDVPMSIYSQVSEIINFYDTANAMVHFIDDHHWPELEYHLADSLHACPPVAFYIDAVDEEFAHAPMEWHRCQKGLFYQVMRFLRDSRLGGRLHIVICIRDIVLSSIYQSEHGGRYRNEPHI